MIIHKANQAHTSGAGRTACGLSCHELGMQAKREGLKEYPWVHPWKKVTCKRCLSKRK